MFASADYTAIVYLIYPNSHLSGLRCCTTTVKTTPGSPRNPTINIPDAYYGPPVPKRSIAGGLVNSTRQALEIRDEGLDKTRFETPMPGWRLQITCLPARICENQLHVAISSK